MTKRSKTSKQSKNIFVRVSTYFFNHARTSLIMFLVLLIAGGVTYSSLIKREGFPPIQFPLSFVNGFYFVDDSSKVDEQLAKPFYEAVSKVEGVESVETTANANDFSGVVFFEQTVDPGQGTEKIRQALEGNLPEAAQVNVVSVDPAAYLNKYDLLLTVYGDGKTEDLEKIAAYIAEEIIKLDEVIVAEPQPLLSENINQETGEKTQIQTSFNRIGVQGENGLQFAEAITVGIDRNSEVHDALQLSDAVTSFITEVDLSQFDGNYNVVVGADFAQQIRSQISSLQDNLLTGLIAVSAVSLLLITWRASLITALFMVLVTAVTVLILYIAGYTLNTITLFALVLSLGLFVDDATIVVESIDAAKKKRKKRITVIKDAIGKIGSASFAGTFTTVLVFLPLAFVDGILGEFIRLMPITVIIALISSLVLSLTVIPVLSKYILLKTDELSWFTRINPISKFEALLAIWVGSLPLIKARGQKSNRIIASLMVAISILGIIAALFFATKTEFNIFPPSKDSDQIGISLSFPEGYDIEQAQEVSREVERIIVETEPDLVNRVSYGSFSIVQPNARQADILIELIPFTNRQRTSPEIIADLKTELDQSINDGTKTKVIQYDSGPPTEEYPFKVQIFSEEQTSAIMLAEEIRNYINGAIITRPNGSEAQINDVRPIDTSLIRRTNGENYVEVAAGFNDDDVSALLVAAKEHTSSKFTDEYLQNNEYQNSRIGYDFGQESENADSFAALGLVFPIALGLMYLLLSLQFKSLLQPLLIFLAIPFTFLGVFGGLYLTDNSLSFFVMVGLIGLIGIAVNNTILLTTYTNQERKSGKGRLDAISNAVTKRFRPLLATTITTIVALLPLALFDPFWEALAFTIIFGLASSTFFVLLSFPYYYLGFERIRYSPLAKRAALWLIGLAIVIAILAKNTSYVLVTFVLYSLATILLIKLWKRVGI